MRKWRRWLISASRLIAHRNTPMNLMSAGYQELLLRVWKWKEFTIRREECKTEQSGFSALHPPTTFQPSKIQISCHRTKDVTVNISSVVYSCRLRTCRAITSTLQSGSCRLQLAMSVSVAEKSQKRQSSGSVAYPGMVEPLKVPRTPLESRQGYHPKKVQRILLSRC